MWDYTGTYSVCPREWFMRTPVVAVSGTAAEGSCDSGAASVMESDDGAITFFLRTQTRAEKPYGSVRS